MTTVETIKLLLKDKPIAYRPALRNLAGSIGATLMLCQAIYWQDRVPRDDGWWWKTAKEWERETGLTASDQRRARSKLRGTPFWHEQLKGVPARMWFRLDMDDLVAVLQNGLPPLSATEIVERYSWELAKLSQVGLMRAKRLGIDAVYVDYSEVVLRDEAVCGICGNIITRGPGQLDDSLHFHHAPPLSNGGQHVIGNIVCAHAACNLRYGNNAEASSFLRQEELERLGWKNLSSQRGAAIPESTSEITTSSADAESEPPLAGNSAVTEHRKNVAFIEEMEHTQADLVASSEQRPERSTEELMVGVERASLSAQAKAVEARWVAWGADSSELKPRQGVRKDEIQQVGYLLSSEFGLDPLWSSKSAVKHWITSCAELWLTAKADLGVIKQAARKLRGDGLVMSGPWSLLNNVRARVAERETARPQAEQQTQWRDVRWDDEVV